MDEEEEFTENLSSDTTAETPNKNIKIREPVLEFGAVDKPFKEFGPALEFEGWVMKDHGLVGTILKDLPRKPSEGNVQNSIIAHGPCGIKSDLWKKFKIK